jgi:hypothetical protein
MKRKWIIIILIICTSSVVLVLRSHSSYSQIRNCKSPDGSQPCSVNNNATLMTVRIRDAQLSIVI